MMRPSLISSSPATIRMAVDLPHPEGPTSTRNSRSSTSMLRSLTAAAPPPPYSLVTPSKITRAMPVLLSATTGPAKAASARKHPRAPSGARCLAPLLRALSRVPRSVSRRTRGATGLAHRKRTRRPRAASTERCVAGPIRGAARDGPGPCELQITTPGPQITASFARRQWPNRLESAPDRRGADRSGCDAMLRSWPTGSRDGFPPRTPRVRPDRPDERRRTYGRTGPA